MNAKELRQTWINFFQQRGYHDVSNRSVIPPLSDKSLLFINSGIAAIKSYFCGDANIPNSKLVSVQRVIRTSDIDSIGKSWRHHTYFEMMGNFSVGGASRREAIALAWEFLVDVLHLDKDKLYVTVFEEDLETSEIWSEFIPKDRIVMCGKNTNFWDMGVGPCGPCTEIYFDKGIDYDEDNLGTDLLKNDINNNRFLEIWNLVFSDFLNIDGNIVPSATHNLDTGAGLERFLTILENKESNFETTLFSPIVQYLSKFVSFSDNQYLFASVDYFRTSCILIRDGIVFGNKGREYVLRKIFRKACSYVKIPLPIESFFTELVVIISGTLDYYDWQSYLSTISSMFIYEYQLSERSNDMAEELLREALDKSGDTIPAIEIFNMVTRHGLSLLSIENILFEYGKSFDKEEYFKLFEEHKKLSFNEKISSAFTKKIPNLLLDAVHTEMDYENFFSETHISDIYYGDDFEKLKQPARDTIDVYIALMRTVIFPVSAGQDNDYGELVIDDSKRIPIRISFQAPNGQILHRLENLDYELQQALMMLKHVRVELDTSRRMGLAQHHTAEHLLYAILKKSFNKEIIRISGSKHEDYFSMEAKFPLSTDKEDLNLFTLNETLNKAISESIEVKTEWGSLDKAKELGIVGQFEEIYEMNKDKLRFVNIGEYGTELCVGTHVKNTRDIESSLIIKFSKKQKNIYRFTVISGNKRIEEFLKINNAASVQEYLGCLQNREAEAKTKKEASNKIFLRNKKQLLNELLEFKEKGSKLNILERSSDKDVALGAIKEARKYLKNQAVVLFFKEGKIFRFFISSQGIDISNVLYKLREKGAKCGGSNSFGSGTWEIEEFRGKIENLFSSLY